MRRTLLFTLLSAIIVLVTSISSVAAQPEVLGRTPTVTRLVVLFSHLEEELSKAVGKHDLPAVSGLLGKDFEMRVNAMPGKPVPRSAWIRQSFAAPKWSRGVAQMAVHDFGNVAVASFLWKITPANSAVAHTVFIVDVWKQQGRTWKLAVRYAGPAARRHYPPPGAPTNRPAFEKKE
ncbi:MAG: nuclear transport factor 2 family protein [Gammaproteobacteria bacterium]